MWVRVCVGLSHECRVLVSPAVVERSNESVHDHPNWHEGRRCIDPTSGLFAKTGATFAACFKRTQCRGAEADMSSCSAAEL